MVEVISNHFLMLRFQKMLTTVGFRTFGGGSRVLNPADKKRDKKFPQCVEGAGCRDNRNHDSAATQISR